MGVKKQFIIDGKAYQTQFKTEVMARFMSDAELLEFIGKYDAVLYQRHVPSHSFKPSNEEMSMWQRFMDGTADQYQLAKEIGRSSAAVMWLMAKV